MAATLSPVDFDGLDSVESFLEEHGLVDSLVVACDIVRQLFPMAERLQVEHDTDPEDGHESVIIVVTGGNLSVEEAVELDMEWTRRICRALEPDALWRIGMQVSLE